MYRLDRTVFSIQSKKDAANTTKYWLSQSPEERWRAAWYLTCCAYGVDYDNPPRLDRSLFSMRKNG
jgi:hypothetical protein